MNNKSVLVTGSCGLIGSEALRSFLSIRLLGRRHQ
jgi:FlaA1/EpsC-like NDP-sugar epimerase